MDIDLPNLVQQAIDEVSKAETEKDLEELRLKYLGRKSGILPSITQKIPSLPQTKRAGMGTAVKSAREKIEKALLSKVSGIQTKKDSSSIDVTTPGKEITTGGLHPLTHVFEEVKEIFHYLGFVWADGPEVETDIYNFQKLNIPPDHPARDAQQTYYLEDDLLLRTHTSNMQVRFMEKNKPPIRAIFPGRTYRRDANDATHAAAFNQIEGLMIDQGVSMTDLLGTLDYFARSFFGKGSKIRVYGHHFPYTEPSMEVEVYHPSKGWLEILGAGMVHPFVLEQVGIDTTKYRGWAFGVGAERLVMLKYDIHDMRLLFDNDLRFLKQF